VSEPAPSPAPVAVSPPQVLAEAARLRRTLAGGFREEVVSSIYAEVERVSRRAVRTIGTSGTDLDQRIDHIVTSRWLGLPLMVLLLAVVFWLTITGANVPSAMLADALFAVEDWAAALSASIGVPGWLVGFVWHGVFRGLAWVISVMLPPMAIFFPLFTLLEDLGYLPRVAFNLDFLFRRAGAHGKQALTMAMGFGCNAAGVIATRIIDSPRERLVAILTNNFVPCNGRFPTLILLATVFVASAFPPAVASLVAAGSVVAIVLLGVAFTLVVSWLLSRTVLKGEASAFTLELPPYTSLIDRTMFVLWRAMQTAAPAGAVIWVLANVSVGDQSLAQVVAAGLQPLGRLMGLDGVILLAYIIAIPANEIVVPTMMMVYMAEGMMIDVPSVDALRALLVNQHGWTLLTAVNLMLFSLLHNPCATTVMTIYRETLSAKWAAVGALLPLGLAVVVTMATAAFARLVWGV